MNGHYAMGGKNSTKFMIIVGFLLIVLILAATFVVLLTSQTKNNPAVEGCSDETGKSEVVLEYKANEEFGPDCLRVTAGTKILYKNDSSAELEVGADPHPLHSGDRELTDDKFSLVVRPGQTSSVIADRKDTYGIHNHQNPSAVARIIVE